jgi:hypothetical protein
MGLGIVFETHSWSEDKERGVVRDWLPGWLSSRGRALAASSVLAGGTRTSARCSPPTCDGP